jgi:hypothetical protein
MDGNPDIMVGVSDSIVPISIFRKKLMADKSRNGSSMVRYTEHLGSLGAQFAINFLSERVEITINKVIAMSKHVLYVNLVEPILRFVLVSKGYVLLHSACIADEYGRGMLLSAPPDTGKTTTVLRCIKLGCSFLSDDMTILEKTKEALCFPKPMTISSHTYNTAKTVATKKSRGIQNMMLRSLVHSKKGRGLMRNMGKHNVPIFTINTVGQALIKPPKFKIEDLFQHVNIRERTRISNLFFLERGGEETRKITISEALKRAIENSDDAFLFPPYKELLQHLNIGGLDSVTLLEAERNLLEKFISNIECTILKSEQRLWFEKVIQISPDTETI